MNTRKEKLVVFSLATILTLSVVGITQIPIVFADNDDKKEKNPNFPKKPQFESQQCFKNTMPPGLPIPDDADCRVQAWYDTKTNSLKYKIIVVGMELVGINSDIADIAKMHFHKAASFMPSGEPMGPMHVLNIFGLPGMDDDDLVVKPTKGIARGIWDDGDKNIRETDLDGNPIGNDNTFAVSEMLGDLCSENIFLMVHGDAPGLPGFLKAPLKLTDDGEKLCKKLDKKGLLE